MSRVALIVVDMQNDFCPPDGSLGVTGGRDIVPTINLLLKSSKFDVKIATKDWHPADHISFAKPPEQKPFESFTTIVNPDDASQTYETRLWPVHCVQGTKGAELVAGLDVDMGKVEKDADWKIIEKGQDSRVEMYSAFYAPFDNLRQGPSTIAPFARSALPDYLKERSVGTVYVVGLAADYCVKATAEDAAKEGYRTFIIEDATKAVDPSGWPGVKAGMTGIGFVECKDVLN
ncbi:nicotinamidase [Roridomyces roridus]|uniref:nicotinamidase n=1 Tax=Roridomyces roridus TaxID=1738132 RepID=A0AAD7FAQ1_9AGAR|nr:nicotinamidase [Roridomyces roridus]